MTASGALGVNHNRSLISAGLARAGVFMERNQLAEAESCLKETGEILTRWPQPLVYRIVHGANQVRLAAALGDPEEALVVLADLRDSAGCVHRPVLKTLLDVIEIRWSIEAGHLRRATRLLPQRSDDLLVETLRARLDLAEGHPETALERIDSLHPITPRDRLSTALLKLRAAGVSDPDSCQEIAIEVAELAVTEGMARLVIEEGPDVLRLVREAAEALDMPSADNLACALGCPKKARIRSYVQLDLSERERSVLRFLPTRLTNQEIGAETFMSVNTVKTHLKHIYAKLNVTSRAAAVDRAKMLGLIL
jgi:LuxR family maltose regulon positive regulatory protein